MTTEQFFEADARQPRNGDGRRGSKECRGLAIYRGAGRLPSRTDPPRHRAAFETMAWPTLPILRRRPLRRGSCNCPCGAEIPAARDMWSHGLLEVRFNPVSAMRWSCSARRAIVIPTFARWRVSPVIGFILIGVLVGPGALGSLVSQHPWLYHITITDRDSHGALRRIRHRAAALLHRAGAFVPAAVVGCAALVFGLGAIGAAAVGGGDRRGLFALLGQSATGALGLGARPRPLLHCAGACRWWGRPGRSARPPSPCCCSRIWRWCRSSSPSACSRLCGRSGHWSAILQASLSGTATILALLAIGCFVAAAAVRAERRGPRARSCSSRPAC